MQVTEDVVALVAIEGITNVGQAGSIRRRSTRGTPPGDPRGPPLHGLTLMNVKALKRAGGGVLHHGN